MSTHAHTDRAAAREEVEVVWIALWCEVCEEEWDVLMTPDEATGDSDPADEFVTCPSCGQPGEWGAPDPEELL